MKFQVKHPPSLFFPSPARARRHGICYVTWSVVFEAHQNLILLSSIAPPPSPRNGFLPRCPVSQENAGTSASVCRPPRIDCGLLQVGIVVSEMTYEVNCIWYGASIGDLGPSQDKMKLEIVELRSRKIT